VVSRDVRSSHLPKGGKPISTHRLLAKLIFLGGSFALSGCGTARVAESSKSESVSTARPIASPTTAYVSTESSRVKAVTTAEASPSPIVLTMTEAPSGVDRTLVFSATNNDRVLHTTTFDARVDQLSPNGEWHEVNRYTTGTSGYPGRQIDPAQPRTAAMEAIEVGETRAGLTVDLGRLPGGQYQLRMIYEVRVVGYNTVTRALSMPITFTIV
jgi:hypothetical protein